MKNLHRPKKIYTDAVRGVRDKYEVCASDGWMVDGHVHQHPSCETSVLFVYVLNDFDITITLLKNAAKMLMIIF